MTKGAERVLPRSGILYLYGPYRENGVHTAPSNPVFNESLRARNPEWGVRNIEDLTDLATAQGLELVERTPMPDNNLSLVFQRRG